MQTLSPRQQSILNRIIDTHIETAQPVGSRSITDLYREIFSDSYSPATVRNEMGLLEEMGYLTHPHTSAGRVPTDLGYRYYVDHGLQQESFSGDFLHRLANDLKNASREIEFLAEKASSLLSSLAEEASLVLMPENKRAKLFLQGASRLLEKPEFQDLAKMKLLLKALEEKVELMNWLGNRVATAAVSITIGHENEREAFYDCTVISAVYSTHGRMTGALAVIGPRRMKYSRTIPLVRQMAAMIETILDQENTE